MVPCGCIWDSKQECKALHLGDRYVSAVSAPDAIHDLKNSALWGWFVVELPQHETIPWSLVLFNNRIWDIDANFTRRKGKRCSLFLKLVTNSFGFVTPWGHRTFLLRVCVIFFCLWLLFRQALLSLDIACIWTPESVIVGAGTVASATFTVATWTLIPWEVWVEFVKGGFDSTYVGAGTAASAAFTVATSSSFSREAGVKSVSAKWPLPTPSSPPNHYGWSSLRCLYEKWFG